MRILFVHEVNYLTKPIFEMHEFPEYLSKMGHEIAFWHFPEGWSHQKAKKFGFSKVIPGRVIEETSIRLYTPALSGSFGGRVLTALLANSLAKRVTRDFRPDLIVSFSVPTQGWQLISASRKAGVPVIFRALDVSHKIRKGFFANLVYMAEKYVYKRVNCVSANNPAMLKYCLSMGAREHNASVDWPPINLSRFQRQLSSGRLRERLEIGSNKKVILYMGSFFYFSGLPEVIRAFAQQENGELLVLVGGGEQEAELRRLSSDLGVADKVIFTGYVSFDDLPEYLKIADVAINPMVPSLVSNSAIPNKIIQYLATGLQVVSTRLEGLVDTFGESSQLWLEATPERVVSKALEICRNSDPVIAIPEENGLERFDLKNAITAFETRCKEVAAIA